MARTRGFDFRRYASRRWLAMMVALSALTAIVVLVAYGSRVHEARWRQEYARKAEWHAIWVLRYESNVQHFKKSASDRARDVQDYARLASPTSFQTEWMRRDERYAAHYERKAAWFAEATEYHRQEAEFYARILRGGPRDSHAQRVRLARLGAHLEDRWVRLEQEQFQIGRGGVVTTFPDFATRYPDYARRRAAYHTHVLWSRYAIGILALIVAAVTVVAAWRGRGLTIRWMMVLTVAVAVLLSLWEQSPRFFVEPSRPARSY